MATGTVKWYDADKGYGFIIPDGGGDAVFVHRAALGAPGLTPGDRVTFAVGASPNGPVAGQVQVTERAGSVAPADQFVIPVHEERLTAATREVRLGEVLVHTRIETVPVETAVELAHDEVSVERVPINRPVDAVPEARYEGDALVVPVVAEELVTTKRLVVREELRITRRRVTEATPLRATVRREVVEVEGRGAEGVTPTEEPVHDPEETRPESEASRRGGPA